MSVLAAESVRLLPVEPVLGAPQNASPAEVQIILRKGMFDYGVSIERVSSSESEWSSRNTQWWIETSNC